MCGDKNRKTKMKKKKKKRKKKKKEKKKTRKKKKKKKERKHHLFDFGQIRLRPAGRIGEVEHPPPNHTTDFPDTDRFWKQVMASNHQATVSPIA